MGASSSKKQPAREAEAKEEGTGGKSEEVQVKKVQDVGSEPPPKSDDKDKVNLLGGFWLFFLLQSFGKPLHVPLLSSHNSL